jgi:hypothetical protein
MYHVQVSVPVCLSVLSSNGIVANEKFVKNRDRYKRFKFCFACGALRADPIQNADPRQPFHRRADLSA